MNPYFQKQKIAKSIISQHSASSPITESNLPNMGIVEGKNVNIRATPSTQSKVILQVNSGDKLEVIETVNNEWIHVKFKGQNAYVYSDFVQIQPTLSEPLLNSSSSFKSKQNLLGITGAYIFIFIILYILAKRFDKKRKTIEIHYDLDNRMNEIYEQFIHSFQSMKNAKKVWQITVSSSGYDRKYNAGASTLVDRKIIEKRIHKLPIEQLKTNATIPYIGLRGMELYFFPERLLVKQNNSFASIMYKNLDLNGGNETFIEDGFVPSDSEIVRYTWQYVNKSGGKDKRFKNNRQIPVCRYSSYHLKSENGLNVAIQISRKNCLDQFSDIIYNIGTLQGRYSSTKLKHSYEKM